MSNQIPKCECGEDLRYAVPAVIHYTIERSGEVGRGMSTWELENQTPFLKCPFSYCGNEYFIDNSEDPQIKRGDKISVTIKHIST